MIALTIDSYFVFVYVLFLKNEKPLACPILQHKDSKFNVPTSRTIDRQLILGTALFGLGWGIAGLCPVSRNS